MAGFARLAWPTSRLPASRMHADDTCFYGQSLYSDTYSHPRLQDFPRWKNNSEKHWETKNSLAAGIRGVGISFGPLG